MNMIGDLTDKVVLVTGASRGIGQAIAFALGKCGATVVGTATSEKGAEAISNALKEQGITGAGKVLNVTDASSVSELLKSMKAEFSHPHILVNNAGITKDNLLVLMKDEQWFDVVNTNLSSVFRLSKACLRSMMKARTGRIINITSVVGSSGNPGQTNYCATKAGVVGFSKSLAQEVASRNITVNCVAPGFIDTDMTRELGEEQTDDLLKGIPLSRLGKVEDIANAVVFLASDQSSYITGQTIHVNGGMYMQ